MLSKQFIGNVFFSKDGLFVWYFISVARHTDGEFDIFCQHPRFGLLLQDLKSNFNKDPAILNKLRIYQKP